MIDWLIDWLLIDWLFDRFIDWSIDWLSDWTSTAKFSYFYLGLNALFTHSAAASSMDTLNTSWLLRDSQVKIIYKSVFS